MKRFPLELNGIPFLYKSYSEVKRDLEAMLPIVELAFEREKKEGLDN